MPRLDGADVETHNIGNNFSFTGARVGSLGATEYTLVDIAVDMSGSVSPFVSELVAMIETTIEACRRSPRSDNLLIRVSAFSTHFQNGIAEIHGYIPLADIDLANYHNLRAYGGTPLYDACFVGVGALNAYAKVLFDQDYLVNGITFIITDGDNTISTATPAMIKAEIERGTLQEFLESHVSVLIGINAKTYANYLSDFRAAAGITQYIDAGDATKGNLAKLAAFVSQSISSTSAAIGTGGASQSIAATI